LVPELQKAGIEFQRGIHEVHPGAFSADFFDPSGNMVSLYEDTNKR
jgi:predicted enzyme related to lactoylglutathione lyase